MNLKALVFALFSSSSVVLGQYLYDEDDYSRQLQTQTRKNEDCDISGSISCRVISDGTDCRDLNIRLDQCKKIRVMMNYTFCNHEPLPADKIVIIPSKSYTNIYESFKERLSFAAVPASSCRSELKARIVDTCRRNRVNADMKLEGWKTKRPNYGSYCHVYKHYFPRINKYTIGPTPSPLPAPSFQVITLCFLETIKGGGDYSIPCEELDLDYFLDSFARMLGNRRRSLQQGLEIVAGTEGGENDIDFERGLRYQFVIESQTGEEVTVDEIKVYIDGEEFVIATRGDNITVGSGQELLVGEFTKEVDFADYSDDDFEISSTITATGAQSGSATSESVQDIYYIP